MPLRTRDPRVEARRLPDGSLEWRLRDARRNRATVDWWSLTHVAWGFALALALPWWLALAIMILWEPFEVLVVSPALARFGVNFGYESLKNSLWDLAFNVLGVALGALLAPHPANPFG